MASRFDGLFTTDLLRAQTKVSHWDDTNTAYFLRQLEEVDETVYSVEYADIKFRSFFPVKGVSNGAESFTYRWFDRFGSAIVMEDYNEDLPAAEVKGYEESKRFKALGSSYNYNFQDIRAMAFAKNVQLDSMKALAARETIERLMDQIACTGYNPSTTGLYGITNAPGVTNTNVAATWASYIQADRTNGTTLATSKIQADLSTLFNSMLVNSQGKHTVNKVLMPLSLWALLNTTPVNPAFTDKTILQFMKGQLPNLIIDWWPQLNASAPAPVNSVSGQVVGMDVSPQNMRWIVSQEFEVLPPFSTGMAWQFPCHARIGGIQVMRPLAVQTLSGAG